MRGFLLTNKVKLSVARKKKNTVDYFPHYIEGGKAMFILESKYKNDGYATWFKILERLGKSENHFINLSDVKEKMYLASKCNINNDRLTDIINDLVELGKFDKYLWEKNIIWSQDLVDSISDVYKRRDSLMPTIYLICQQLGIKCEQKHISKEQNDNGNQQSKVKYSKVKKTIYKDFVFFESESFYHLWLDYLEMRKKIRKPTTEKAEQLGLNKLVNLSKENIGIAILIVEQSIFHSWQGLFPLKKDFKEQIKSNSYYEKYPDLFNEDGTPKTVS